MFCFSRSGRTTACLKESSSEPDERDSLIMEVIVPTVLSRCFIKRGVGIGSRQQDFGGDEIIMDLTSSSVTHRGVVERATPGEEVLGSIPDVVARPLLVGSVSA